MSTDAKDRMAKARAARAAKQKAAKLTETIDKAAEDGGFSKDEVKQLKAQVAETETADRAKAQRVAAEEAEKAVTAPVGPTNNERVAAKLENEAGLRERAARQRVTDGPVAIERVRVRITKSGHGRVSMGQHVPGIGEAHYEWKEEPEFSRDTAEALEARGFVEIL